MKLFIFIVAFLCAAYGQDVCCLAPGASSCTEGIPLELCLKAQGVVVDASTTVTPTEPVDLEGTCCCFGADAGESDRCLPGVDKAVCLGPSVQGTCEPDEQDTCCCRPAGEVNDLNCIPRIPQPLCEKASGAECVVEVTATPLCTCRLPPAPGSAPGTPDRIQRLTESICNKFQGECEVAPDTCCCIVTPTFNAAGQEIFPSPNDPGVPDRGECIVVTKDECLGTGGRKRDGVCHNPVVEEVEPRCRCQDPSVIGRVEALDELILVHVCEEKLGSNCIPAECCCKYPSAPNEPCLEGVLQTTCTAVGGAQCIGTNQVGELGDVKPEFSSPFDVDCTATTFTEFPAFARVVGGARLPLESVSSTVNVFDTGVFAQQLDGSETVYTAQFGETLEVSVSPASSDFLLYFLNLKGTFQTLNPSVYTIDVVPTTTVPGILSGFVGADGLIASPTPDMVPGRYRISFPNTAPVSGILAFSGPVQKVKIVFPSVLPTAPTDAFSTSGIIPSFVDGAAFPPLQLAPGLLNPNPTYSIVDLTDDSTRDAPLTPSLCGDSFAEEDDFPCLPPPAYFDISDLSPGECVKVDFISEQDPDSVCLYLTNVPAGTYSLRQESDDDSAPPAIDSGFENGSLTGWDFTTTGTESGVIKFHGAISALNFCQDPTRRRALTNFGLVCGPCNPDAPTPDDEVDVPPLYARY